MAEMESPFSPAINMIEVGHNKPAESAPFTAEKIIGIANPIEPNVATSLQRRFCRTLRRNAQANITPKVPKPSSNDDTIRTGSSAMADPSLTLTLSQSAGRDVFTIVGAFELYLAARFVGTTDRCFQIRSTGGHTQHAAASRVEISVAL